jgi:thiol-disulfide isomerase/thioredoxin
MRHAIYRRWNSFLVLAATTLALAGPAHAGDEVTATLDAALKEAQARHVPVLVDFYAPWCYSCYFMAKKVKNGPEWERLEHHAVVLELDADAPDGAHWISQWQVKGLPNYVVLDESGKELGRIQLERTRAQFYPEIDAILARGATLDTLQGKVRDGSADSVRAARGVLQAFHARRDPDAGLGWRSSQPAAVTAALDADTEATLWTSRLQLQRAAQAKDAAQCAAIAPRVLAGELGCERAYELDRALECTASLPLSEKTALFGGQKAAMEKLLAGRVLIPKQTCADARSVVETSAALAEALADKKGEAGILDRAIVDATARLGGSKADAAAGNWTRLKLKQDRNLADNLRVYLDIADRRAALEALFPKLIAAYPEDYVYAYRFGKYLAGHGEYAKALPYFEQAAPLAYGVNRLNVAQLRAETLLKLGRETDAKQVVADALKANGPFFPELTTKLKAVVASSG